MRIITTHYASLIDATLFPALSAGSDLTSSRLPNNILKKPGVWGSAPMPRGMSAKKTSYIQLKLFNDETTIPTGSSSTGEGSDAV